MQFLGGNSAAILCGSRCTGILYAVYAATFTAIQIAVRLYMYPNHSEALFFINSHFLPDCFVFSF